MSRSQPDEEVRRVDSQTKEDQNVQNSRGKRAYNKFRELQVTQYGWCGWGGWGGGEEHRGKPRGKFLRGCFGFYP